MIFKCLPNVFTLIRFLLIGPFLFCFFQKNYANAFYLFVLAGFTDGLDGWLARQFNWQTRLGLFMDPIADKLLIASSFVSLAWIGLLPWWLIELVFFRDISIFLGVFAWYRLMHRSLDFHPSRLSKLNTVLELLLVSYCLFELAFLPIYPWLRLLLIALIALTTTLSYIDYMWMWAKKASHFSTKQ
jgi:cardiolipin synthase